MKHIEKLAALRSEMQAQNIDAYIIPSSDPHISEYLPKPYQCISWLSGFTGSAGTLVVTADFAGLWTDVRYFVQAESQLKDSGFELVKLKSQGVAEYIYWLAEHLQGTPKVAFDGKCTALLLADQLRQVLSPLGFNIDGQVDLIERIWEGRPALPTGKAYLIDDSYTGLATDKKLSLVRAAMQKERADLHLVSSLDDLAWLFNIRGTDVSCNPVVLGFGLLSATTADLFIDLHKLSAEDQQTLEAFGVSLKDYNTLFPTLAQLRNKRVWIDPKRTCSAVQDAFDASNTIFKQVNPSTNFKAVKNETEINHMRHAMVNDGLALTKFYKWLEEHVASGTLTEMSIADKLEQLRAAQPDFVDISFNTIAGYLDHGALPHYQALEAHQYTLKPKGLLLVDSGGQYKIGTTDITRVVSLGEMTEEEQKDYTLVLKGTIEGSMAHFPKGTRGYAIDAITRRPMWEHLYNYGHGTGHGIGFFLNVHEGPQVFNPSNVDVPIEVGMITSIEPGLYRVGEHGIRIENLVLAKDLDSSIFGDFMHFETLTICYIDTELVDKKYLDAVHIKWLNNYNEWVYQQLAPQLDDAEKAWLRNKTQAI